MRTQEFIKILITVEILATSLVLFAPTQLGFTPVKTGGDILQKYYIGQNETSHITKVF